MFVDTRTIVLLSSYPKSPAIPQSVITPHHEVQSVISSSITFSDFLRKIDYLGQKGCEGPENISNSYSETSETRITIKTQ